MLIIATRSPSLRLPDEQLLQSPRIRAELQRVGIRSVADFQSREIGDSRTIGPLLQALPDPANSDFFPYIDLNAPRLRYLRSTAIELPALTVLPIPLLELLGGHVSSGPTAEPDANSALFRDRLVQRALEIQRAIERDDLNGLDPLSARYLAHLELTAERCGEPAGREDWHSAMRAISDETSAYLHAEELTPLWSKVLASPCYRAAAPEGRAWADLLAAIARRDAARIASLGSELLNASGMLSDEERAYLTTVTVAACLGAADEAEARRLLQSQRPRIEHAGQFDFALRELLALTRSTSAKSLAQAQP